MSSKDQRGSSSSAVCWHGAGVPGYWPWTQALDALAAAVGPALGPATDLGDKRTFLLFDATARWIASAARRRPAVVVLDDLHWADQSSPALLDFLARARLEAPS
jgi:AAA ATPase domain